MTDTPKRQSAERLCEQIHGNGVKHNSTCACPILGPALAAEHAAGVEAGRREGLRAAIAKMMIRAGAALEGRRLSEYECNDSRFIRSRAFTVAVEAIERLLAEGPEKEGE